MLNCAIFLFVHTDYSCTLVCPPFPHLLSHTFSIATASQVVHHTTHYLISHNAQHC